MRNIMRGKELEMLPIATENAKNISIILCNKNNLPRHIESSDSFIVSVLIRNDSTLQLASEGDFPVMYHIIG